MDIFCFVFICKKIWKKNDDKLIQHIFSEQQTLFPENCQNTVACLSMAALLQNRFFYFFTHLSRNSNYKYDLSYGLEEIKRWILRYFI